MNGTDLVCTMARYNHWANAELYTAVEGLPEGEATKERPTLHKTIIGALNHLLLVDTIWWGHLHGQSHGHKALNEVLHEEFRPLREARVDMDERLVAYADDLSEEAADEEIEFMLIGGNTGKMSRSMALMHMFNHNTFHRGFVVESFCQIPAALPIIDLTVFLRGDSGLRVKMPHFQAVNWTPA